MMTADLPDLTPEMTMAEVLRAYPGAQRALFARYHIGGCSSCAFSPTETLADLCARNDGIPVDEVIQHIRDSYSSDANLQIAPGEFAALRQSEPGLKVLDVRTREEYEAVHLPEAILMTQEVVQEAFAKWNKTAPLVLYDHTGSRSMDAVAYFIGHGFANARCLAGGIDAYSAEVDPALPRYKIEMEA
ncbi:MAG: rhodanese-like domain-containing protein [Prosthecobacter sp.]|nr:rhodanese-like domain-containing protein [Prosthecobacter sp.]